MLWLKEALEVEGSLKGLVINCTPTILSDSDIVRFQSQRL